MFANQIPLLLLKKHTLDSLSNRTVENDVRETSLWVADG